MHWNLLLMPDDAACPDGSGSAAAQLAAEDRLEWLAALAILGPVALPEGAVWLSASHEELGEALVRAQARDQKAIVLAGRAQTALRRKALDAGAFDFLTTGKIDPAELTARLQLLQTGASLPGEIALNERVLRIDGSEHALSQREAGIMALLIEAKGRFVTHERLLSLWGRHASEPQYLRVAIRQLRRRIEPEPDLPRYLLSEAAIGYRLAPGIAPITA